MSSYLVVTAGLLNGQILSNYSFGEIVTGQVRSSFPERHLDWKASVFLRFGLLQVQEKPGSPAMLFAKHIDLFKI